MCSFVCVTLRVDISVLHMWRSALPLSERAGRLWWYIYVATNMKGQLHLFQSSLEEFGPTSIANYTGTAPLHRGSLVDLYYIWLQAEHASMRESSAFTIQFLPDFFVLFCFCFTGLGNGVVMDLH